MTTADERLISIFKTLDFEEQLNLAQESTSLRGIFESRIWPVDYRNLQVYRSSTQYIVANETERNRLLLNEDVFAEFLSFYREKVQFLTLFSTTGLDLKAFKNLKSLAYWGDDSWPELLRSVSEDVPQLESLHIKYHIYDDWVKLWPDCGEDITVAADILEKLQKLKNLHFLSIDLISEGLVRKINYKQFAAIIANSKLEVLKLSFILEGQGENASLEAEPIPAPVQLIELNLTTSFDPQKWPSNLYQSFLKMFAQLSVLCLTVTDRFTSEDLAIVAISCKNLLKLTLHNTTFGDVRNFFLPPKLRELQLKYCRGLNYDNLKQILKEFEIETCISYLCDYEGTFEDFCISPRIQTLKLTGIDMCKFSSAYRENMNLKNLQWHHAKTCNGRMRSISLASCQNLETLDMQYHSQVQLDSLHELRHLYKFTTIAILPLEDILLLLQHPSLTDLSFGCNNLRTDEANSGAPLEVCPTKVINLKVTYHSDIETDLDFWLGLISENINMTLAISTPDMTATLKALIRHKLFPESLQSVEMYGFKVDCNALRTNFEDAINKYRYVNNVFADTDSLLKYIVISR